MLCLLAQNAGRVLTHTFIMENIWGSNWEKDIASLRVFMATLRRKLEKTHSLFSISRRMSASDTV